MVSLRDFYVLHPSPAVAAAHHEQFYSQSPLPSPQPPHFAGHTTCQDCGNQAKKDCGHRRCRTCCKSRGYDCSTHIKSTWVSAARRRERNSAVKKPRLSAAASNSGTPPRSFDTDSSHQDLGFRENLPGNVTAPAVFKCVRVTSIHDGEDEYAYHAKVSIGGHVFKGFLYNQGCFDEGIGTHINGASSSIDVNNNNNNNNNTNDDANINTMASTIPNFSDLQLGGGIVRNNVPHADVYGFGTE